MIKSSNFLLDMVELAETVKVSECTVISVNRICTIRAEVSANEIVQKIVAEFVALVPSRCTNLLSVSD